MLVDQITHHLPKDNEEVNTHVKCLQMMLDATIMMTTSRVLIGTWPTASLRRRSAAEVKGDTSQEPSRLILKI
jgi:thiamine phosphate synthase YjbQ (UPF0047 family)